MKPRLSRRRNQLDPIPHDAARALARGPADERRDAVRVVLPSAAEIMRTQQFQQVYAMAKADNIVRPRPGAAMAMVDIGDTRAQHIQFARPVGLSFDQLRQVYAESLITKLVVNTRIRQVQAFLNIPDGEADPGFALRFKDKRRPVLDEDHDRFYILTQYLLNCGMEFDPRRRKRMGRDDLDDFTAKHLRDSLVLDHAPIELVPTKLGDRVHGFQAVDGGHVYLTDPSAGMLDYWEGQGEYNLLTGRPDITEPQDVIAVYEKDGVAKALYTHDEMMIPIRNVTSDERYYGYGMPETEEVLKVITAFSRAFNLNVSSIDDNALPRGILGISGDYNQEDLDALTYRLESEMRGGSNRYRVMMMRLEQEGGGVNWIPTGGEPQEQLYARWITLNVAINCSAYGMNPEEIAFDSYSAGNSALSGSDTEAKLTSGSDKGLTTLLKWYRKTLNELLALQDPDVELVWNGLRTSHEEALQREDSLMTWGEKRRQYGLTTDHIPKELLNMPLNPVLSSIYQQVAMPQQQGDPGEGDPNDPQAAAQQEAKAQAQGGDDWDEPESADGERRFDDHEGGLWQVPHQQSGPAEGEQPQVQQGDGEEEEAQQPQRMSKAAQETRYQPRLDVWPAPEGK